MSKSAILGDLTPHEMMDNQSMNEFTRGALVVLLLFWTHKISIGQTPSYYLDKGRGWFWKEPMREPTPPQPESPNPLPAKEDPPSLLEKKPPPEPLTSAWFRENLASIRDQALDHPTPENVRRYFRVQKFMLDKAEHFSEMAQTIVVLDADLDENRNHPIAPFGAHLRNLEQDEAKNRILEILRDRAGILYLYRSDCPYCHQMVPILNILSKVHGFPLYGQSLDGKPIKGLQLKREIRIRDIEGHLGVTATPALFLMIPGKGIYRIGEGSLSLSDLIQRLETLAHALGLIPKNLHEASRGTKTPSSGKAASVADDLTDPGLP